MGLFTTLKKLILPSVDKDKSESVSLEAIILKCQKTGRPSLGGDEVKLLLHVSPSNGRSYLKEYIDVYQDSQIKDYLQPGQLVQLEMNPIKGKAILSWKE